MSERKSSDVCRCGHIRGGDESEGGDCHGLEFDLDKNRDIETGCEFPGCRCRRFVRARRRKPSRTEEAP